jgi:transposase
MRARHRLSKLLLRHGIVYYGGAAWTGAHDRWLRTVAAPQLTAPATRMAFDADYDHVLTMQARRGRLDSAIEETGFALAVEIGDWHRFTCNTIGSFVGLVPSEFSSGSSRVQGPITKTGNTHVRRLLVEAAWHHRPRYHVGAVMRSRWDRASAAARARGDEGNRRLHGRWVGFLERRKRPVVANVAIARELAGWCWSLAVMQD